MLAIALWCILMLLPNAYLLGLHILLWNWGRIMWLNFAVCSYSSCTQMLPVQDSIKMLRDAQWCDEWQMHCNSLNIACDGRIWNACKCRMHANLRTMHPLMHVFIMLLEWTWMMFHASWENSMECTTHNLMSNAMEFAMNLHIQQCEWMSTVHMPYNAQRCMQMWHSGMRINALQMVVCTHTAFFSMRAKMMLPDVIECGAMQNVMRL